MSTNHSPMRLRLRMRTMLRPACLPVATSAGSAHFFRTRS